MDDTDRGREPQARALATLLGREERLEGVVHHFRRHAHARVRNPQGHVRSFDRADVASSERAVEVQVDGFDGQGAAVGHGVCGVDREIQDHLLELRTVDPCQAEIGFEPHDQAYVFADQSTEHRRQPAQHLVEVDQSSLHRLAAAEGQQRLCQRRGPG